MPTQKNRHCLHCQTPFTTKYSKKVYCTRTCKDKAAHQMRHEKHFGAQVKHWFQEHTPFFQKREQYADRVVPYETPSGKAYIGLAKKPLMKNKHGYGFQGVLLQSENRNLVQCSECGGWMRQITAAHLRKHGLTTKQYREKFGLNAAQGLISDMRHIALMKQCEEQLGGLDHVQKFAKGRKKLQERNKEVTKSGKRVQNKNTMQQYNAWGTCPEQLKAAVANYIHRFHRLPTNRSPKKGGCSKAKTLIQRFGSLNKAFEAYGLPKRYTQGSRQEFVFPDGTVVHIVKGYGWEELYALMLMKCPLLTKYPM